MPRRHPAPLVIGVDWLGVATCLCISLALAVMYEGGGSRRCGQMALGAAERPVKCALVTRRHLLDEWALDHVNSADHVIGTKASVSDNYAFSKISCSR